jgi:hypothetical protein
MAMIRDLGAMSPEQTVAKEDGHDEERVGPAEMLR